MDKRVKELWVTALRSGEYEQGKGFLAVTEAGKTRYCCLGVLCELAVKDGEDLDVTTRMPDSMDDFMDAQFNVKFYDGSSEMLPDAVVRWSGVPDINPTIGKMRLAYINDSGTTFEDIADLIDKHL